jgi:hypothetical protein
MRLRRLSYLLLLAGASATTILACGSRTGLLVSDEVAVDATPDRKDAGRDADADADVVVVEEDALPPIDVQKDVPKPPPLGCVDAGSTQIYLISSQNQLIAFYPPTLSFTTIGTISCPGANGQTPFSMGVERSGIAYSVFTDGKLYRLSTATAGCQATPYVAGQQGYTTFGMGYAGDQLGEKLYVSDNQGGKGLASIDTQTFQLSFIGAYAPALPPRCEMTGTSLNELFAYCINSTSGGVVAQIDRTNAKVIAASPVKVGTNSDAFAFAYWGGDFYMFNSPPNAPTSVTRYDPVTKTETVVATHPSQIVGAGVSTCAPN